MSVCEIYTQSPGWDVGGTSQLSTSKLGCRTAEGAGVAGQNWLILDSHYRWLQKGLWQTEECGVSQEPSVCPQHQQVLSSPHTGEGLKSELQRPWLSFGPSAQQATFGECL